MQDRLRRSLLLDYYGGLLTNKQKEIYDIYYQQDLSLGEIADLQEVSRNAVYDILNRTNDKLEHYEKVLGLIQADFNRNQHKSELTNKFQLWQNEIIQSITKEQNKQLSQMLQQMQQL